MPQVLRAASWTTAPGPGGEAVAMSDSITLVAWSPIEVTPTVCVPDRTGTEALLMIEGGETDAVVAIEALAERLAARSRQ